jgi:hypothetical protein
MDTESDCLGTGMVLHQWYLTADQVQRVYSSRAKGQQQYVCKTPNIAFHIVAVRPRLVLCAGLAEQRWLSPAVHVPSTCSSSEHVLAHFKAPR